jgi:hypothetical protein
MSESKYLKGSCHFQIFVCENATNSHLGCSCLGSL